MGDELTLLDGTPLERAFRLPSNAEIEAAEANLLSLPQVEVPLTHNFAPGIYLREVVMEAGTLVIGHEHTTEHFNIVLTGSASVMIDGVPQRIEAPCTFISKAGVRKILLIHETMVWQTIHPNPYNERHIPTLEADHVIHSASYEKHIEDARNLTLALESTSPTP